MERIEIYTDGSCPRTGKNALGGWAAHIENLDTDEKIILHGSFKGATNNSMELMGIQKSLKLLTKKSYISIYSDSKYCVNGINSWMHSWSMNNWTSNMSGSEIKNLDIWKDIHNSCRQHKVSANWVPGHKGIIKNELCDLIASKSPIQSAFPMLSKDIPEVRLFARTFQRHQVLWGCFITLPKNNAIIKHGTFYERDSFKKTLNFCDILNEIYEEHSLENYSNVLFVFRFFNLHELIYNKETHLSENTKKRKNNKEDAKAFSKITSLKKLENKNNIITVPGNYFINLLKKELTLDEYISKYIDKDQSLCLYPKSPRARRGV